ncbi:hypothetical protein N9356_04095, partial [Porticoccaceae bacterium]|nr:hypothetical protein [Porticoccaceae bacterium]
LQQQVWTEPPKAAKPQEGKNARQGSFESIHPSAPYIKTLPFSAGFFIGCTNVVRTTLGSTNLQQQVWTEPPIAAKPQEGQNARQGSFESIHPSAPYIKTLPFSAGFFIGCTNVVRTTLGSTNLQQQVWTEPPKAAKPKGSKRPTKDF